jgi:hypothetical protein
LNRKRTRKEKESYEEQDWKAEATAKQQLEIYAW